MEPLTREQRHKILREVYRNYLSYESFISATGQDVIEHKGVQISFSDLKFGIKELSPRKREAFFYNVILDMRQKDVAERMGITTVSVGQYVDAAMIQLGKRYFAEDPMKTDEDEPEDRTLEVVAEHTGN
jgi:DNA-directed RNA polymerase specialized sigma24 family protein